MEKRQYKDVAGNPCSLEWLVRNEPEWAANQIRNRDILEAENQELIKRLRDALPILRDYAKRHPRWLAADMQIHDPNGVNGLIEEVESILSNTKVCHGGTPLA